jgi:hypothetical protein
MTTDRFSDVGMSEAEDVPGGRDALGAGAAGEGGALSGSRPRLSDQALVVRCGQPPFDLPIPLCERCVHHEGVYGFSVQSADQVPFEGLASWCPNNKVGVATVGEIRALGYDVVITAGKGYHATVVVPNDWDLPGSSSLIRLFREQSNPLPRRTK